MSGEGGARRLRDVAWTARRAVHAIDIRQIFSFSRRYFMQA